MLIALIAAVKAINMINILNMINMINSLYSFYIRYMVNSKTSRQHTRAGIRSRTAPLCRRQSPSVDLPRSTPSFIPPL